MPNNLNYLQASILACLAESAATSGEKFPNRTLTKAKKDAHTKQCLKKLHTEINR